VFCTYDMLSSHLYYIYDTYDAPMTKNSQSQPVSAEHMQVVSVPRGLTISMSPHLQLFLRGLAKREDRNISRTVERLIRSGLKQENIGYQDPADKETT